MAHSIHNSRGRLERRDERTAGLAERVKRRDADDKTVTLRANTFKRSRYKFAGWAKKKNGKVAYKNKAKVKNLTDKDGKTVTLYAVWKKAK